MTTGRAGGTRKPKSTVMDSFEQNCRINEANLIGREIVGLKLTLRRYRE